MRARLVDNDIQYGEKCIIGVNLTVDIFFEEKISHKTEVSHSFLNFQYLLIKVRIHYVLKELQNNDDKIYKAILVLLNSSVYLL